MKNRYRNSKTGNQRIIDNNSSNDSFSFSHDTNIFLQSRQSLPSTKVNDVKPSQNNVKLQTNDQSKSDFNQYVQNKMNFGENVGQNINLNVSPNIGVIPNQSNNEFIENLSNVMPNFTMDTYQNSPQHCFDSIMLNLVSKAFVKSIQNLSNQNSEQKSMSKSNISQNSWFSNKKSRNKPKNSFRNSHKQKLYKFYYQKQEQKTGYEQPNFIIKYMIEFINIENMEILQYKQDQFEVGYINPYLSNTIQILAEEIVGLYEGCIHYFIENIEINNANEEVNLKICCFMQPLQLSDSLNFTYKALKNGKIEGLRVSTDKVQIKWSSIIDMKEINLKKSISIDGFSIKLSTKLRRGATIIFNKISLLGKDGKQFRNFLQIHNSALNVTNIKDYFYDAQLNIGVVHL